MNYFIIIDAVTLILGIYIIFVSLRMKKSGKIESTFVAEDEMKKIKDTAVYLSKVACIRHCDFCYQYSCDSFGLPQKNTVLVICGDDYIRRSNYLVFKYVTKCQRKIC
mgnify:CR=1 FL=1